MNSDDPTLRRLFVSLREEEQQSAPSYQQVILRARHRKAAASQGRLNLRWLIPSAAAAMAVLLLCLPHRAHLRPSIAQALPGTLLPNDKAAPLFGEIIPSPAHPSGSDCLLPFHLRFQPL